jgi:ubiquinone/menaquinone biosynthesis C-methylase UbiE
MGKEYAGGVKMAKEPDINKSYILQQFDNTAEKYASREFIQESLGVRRLRRKLLQSAYGNVLEVAAGTGVNLLYYPNNCHLTAIDFSKSMLQIAMNKATRENKTVDFKVMDAEALQFFDRSFDTVVSTLALCTFPNPTLVLNEMARVCKDNGQILLLEHGRSDRQWLGNWQDRKVRQHARRFGCIWNREPEEIVQQAGLQIIYDHRYFFGIFHLIKARPGQILESFSLLT